jgi:hypothetical protein
MENINISLIYPENKTVGEDEIDSILPNISNDVLDELELNSVFDLRNSRLSDYFTYDKEVIEYRQKVFKDMLECPDIAKTLNKLIPILTDIMELRRLEADSGDTASYLSRCISNEYAIYCVSSEVGNSSFYLYRSSALEISAKSFSEGTSSIEMLSFTKKEFGLDFTICELCAGNSPSSVGKWIMGSMSERTIVLGTLFDEEDAFLSSCQALERLSYNENAYDVYMSGDHVFVSDMVESRATASYLTLYSFTLFDN